MLGIFMIICLAAFWAVKLKQYCVLKKGTDNKPALDADEVTFRISQPAAMWDILSRSFSNIACITCLLPLLFIFVGRSFYLPIAILCYAPLSYMAYVFYLVKKNPNRYLIISPEKIDYHGRKPFIANVTDIKRISGFASLYFIHLKGKSKRPRKIYINIFYNKNRLQLLLKKLQQSVIAASGKKPKFANKLLSCANTAITNKFSDAFFKIVITSILLYTSYCCIDYDFYKKDYTALFNAINADPNQTDNAWPLYIQTAQNYIELPDEFQYFLYENSHDGRVDFNDTQADTLRQWFNDNASAWQSLKNATEIDYCNSTYEHISIYKMGSDNFSNPRNIRLSEIREFYNYANIGCIEGVLDLHWLDLLQMQTAAAKHFKNEKTLIDYLFGIALFESNIRLIAGQENFELDDINKARSLLDKYFPEGLSNFNIEGEILIFCSTNDDMLNHYKIPFMTPLNQMFLLCGSRTGTEKAVRKQYQSVLEKAHKGIEVKYKKLSILDFPILRNAMLNILEPTIVKVYELSQRTDTTLQIVRFILDLEEYKIKNNSYPQDISQLTYAGLTTPLPNDRYSNSSLIYRADGQTAILYSVGKNEKDDNGIKADNDPNNTADDRIYWQRN